MIIIYYHHIIILSSYHHKECFHIIIISSNPPIPLTTVDWVEALAVCARMLAAILSPNLDQGKAGGLGDRSSGILKHHDNSSETFLEATLKSFWCSSDISWSKQDLKANNCHPNCQQFGAPTQPSHQKEAQWRWCPVPAGWIRNTTRVLLRHPFLFGIFHYKPSIWHFNGIL